MWKRGEIAPQEQFLLFSTLFYISYIFLTSGVKLHIRLLNVVVQFTVFLTLSILICRSTDISNCFSDSLGIRDNGSRLYIWDHWAYCGIFENGVLLMYMREGVCSVANFITAYEETQ